MLGMSCAAVVVVFITEECWALTLIHAHPFTINTNKPLAGYRVNRTAFLT